ncbi:hypothetical protein BHE74_00001915 [Ensete ventricosum]|nr:hypothetical protein BHE74_00001915 [Ensete ventricosum]
MLADRRREPLQKQALLLQMKLRIQILIDFELEVPHFEATNGDLYLSTHILRVLFYCSPSIILLASMSSAIAAFACSSTSLA